MKNTSSPIEFDLNNAFEKTPAGFSTRLAHSLNAVAVRRTAKRPARWIPIVAACLLLFGGGALAAKSLGVLDFLTNMTTMPLEAAVVESNIQKPVNQRYDGEQLILQARDYLWNNMKFSLALHASPKKPDAFRLINQGDFGVDGINMDNIWWEGEITTLDKWLPKGKQALVIGITHLSIGGLDSPASNYWVPEDQGKTFILEANLVNVTPEQYEKMLDDNGNIKITVPVSSWVYGSETKEESTLTVTAAAPTIQEWRELYDHY